MQAIIPIPTIDVIGDEYNHFFEFLIKYNILYIGLATVIGNEVSYVFSDLMSDIISPILAKIIGSNEKKIEHITVKCFGITFNIGNFLYTLLNFAIIMIILYYFTKFLNISDKM